MVSEQDPDTAETESNQQNVADEENRALRRSSARGRAILYFDSLPDDVVDGDPDKGPGEDKGQGLDSWFRQCACDGDRTGLIEWISRLFARSPYNYKVEPYAVAGEEDYYFIARYKRGLDNDEGSYLCDCGRWVGLAGGVPQRALVRDFRNSRSADEFVRRLRHGVPQRYELLMILAAGIGGALPYIIVEIVRAL